MLWHLPFLPRKDDLVLGRTGPYAFFPALRLRVEERATHMYVLGITGQGKSKLLEHCLVQDILAGRGCGVIDPHADLARDLLTNLAHRGWFKQAKQRQRLLYFDPSRPDGLIPFNVLAAASAPYATAVNLVEAFRRTWPESLREAPRFTNILLASLLVLMANRLTLADLPRLLTDKVYREELLQAVPDGEIVSVFHDRLDRWGREEPLILESVLNKVSAFTLNPLLRRILGHQENHLDCRAIMDEGRVLIADLGRCDGETRRLLGSLIVTGIEQAALSRKDEPQRARRPFYLYVDEFQDFCANDSSIMTLSHILSESRKFGLHLTLAHQTLGQMTSERLRSALGNVGTKIVFAADRADAEVMARQLFLVSGEAIKHEVEDEHQQEKSHPVYYSLPEAWEQATQAIQTLKPRTCLVKTSRGGVRQVYTIPIPAHALSEKELEAVRRALLSHVGRSDSTSTQVEEKREEKKQEISEPVVTTYYEPVEASPAARTSRQRIREWQPPQRAGQKLEALQRQRSNRKRRIR
jgi:Type IV secretion-system coupling protein DNA-binding domain